MGWPVKALGISQALVPFSQNSDRIMNIVGS